MYVSRLQHEWDRSQRIKRTFTDVGFARGRLPPDLFSSMSSYYYNNRDNRIFEEWNSGGEVVNWWEANIHMVLMPWGLKVHTSDSVCTYYSCLYIRYIHTVCIHIYLHTLHISTYIHKNISTYIDMVLHLRMYVCMYVCNSMLKTFSLCMYVCMY